ncbi:MAG TPA: sialidase family protein [Acidimicrobiales bacterium]|nr:sialidase family protein [Acidimicrobiales bacterium]
MRRALLGRGAVAAGLLLPLATVAAGATASPGNVKVTDQAYAKANGAAPDAVSTSCSSNNRQQNEPSVAMDPMNPGILVAGANDYCTVEKAGGSWAGFYRSTTGGSTWTNSLLPGYPGDASPEGQASPLQKAGIQNAGDPVQAWDTAGRLFYMGNAFSRTRPASGSIWVATYDQEAAHYVRTVVVGKGTPSPLFLGRFNDKTSIEVDRTGGGHDGSVYAAWSIFNASGNNSILFVRSTDHGATFSKPLDISNGVHDNQDPDIAVTRDGTVYVVWRQFDFAATGQGAGRGGQESAVVFARSTDGGATFSRPAVLATFTEFDAADQPGDPAAYAQAAAEAFASSDGEAEAGTEATGARDCGDGPFACTSGYVFFRHDSQPRATADQTAGDNTLFVAFDGAKPSTVTASTSTYQTSGPGLVAQGAIYFVTISPTGAIGTPKLLDDQPAGHQWFPDINADGGVLHAVWHDSRLDDGYSVQRPPGDAAALDSSGRFHKASSGIDTWGASSTDGGTTWTSSRLSTQSQNPNLLMFGNRRSPFHGDYNTISSVGRSAFGTWTDTRDVLLGTDIRYPGQAEDFQVHQCRATTDPSVADACPNEGGIDQNVYGALSSS